MITVNSNNIEWHEGMTVRDVLNFMGYDFSLITVTVNENFVSEDDYDVYHVPDKSDVKAMHLHHGG